MTKGKKTEQVDISIDQLRLDPNNPRLPSRLNGADENEILRWMLQDASIFELMNSIGQQGYFSGEPLLVAKTESKDRYIVVEGNRRLAALKLLQHPGQVDIRQKTLQSIVEDAVHPVTPVPCIVYEAREDILDYLGFRHVTGIKSWGPLAKARYLQDLSSKYADETEGKKYQLLAKSIGSRSDYVKRMLAGLNLYRIIAEEDYYDIQDLNERTLSFSLVTTALGHPGIVNFLGLERAQDLEQPNLNRKHLRDLTRWMFEEKDGRTRLGESRNFRKLNKVVASEIALEQFRNGYDLDEALIYTDGPSETFRKLLEDSRENLKRANGQFYLIRDGLKNSDQDLLENIRDLADNLDIVLTKKLRRAREI